MQFSANVTAVTRETIVPKVFDQVLNGNVTALRFLGNAHPWSSGYRYDVPIKWKSSGLGGVTGIADRLDTSRTTNKTKMSFEPRMITKPVVLADIEVELNQGDERVIELLASEFDSQAQELADEFGTEMYEGSGAGDRWDSFDMASDDATNYSSYGGLARATFAVLNGELDTAIGALALSDMAALYDEVAIGNKRPTLAPTTPGGFTAYEGLLQPSVRMNIAATGFPKVTRTGQVPGTAALGGDLGFDSLAYRGTPIVADEKCPSQKLYMLNEQTIGFHGVNLSKYERPNLKGVVEGAANVPVPRGFNWTGLRQPTDQLAEVGHLVLVGNVISTSPRNQGRMEGITG